MSTHKLRADWFQSRTSFPSRERARVDLGRPDAATGPKWTELGPFNIGGRLTSLVVHPHDPKRVCVGSAGGGVWQTRDLGKTWKSAWDDHLPTLNIGSLALDPRNPDVIYAGTGEANLSGDNYPGTGLYRNKGPGWELAGDVADREITTPDFGGALLSLLGIPRRIGTIAIDPFTPGHMLVGGVTHSGEISSGMFESHGGGINDWIPALDSNNSDVTFINALNKTGGIFISSLSYFCHCIQFHPAQPGVVFATVEARGVKSGIWISRDAGKSWKQALKGLPSPDQFGRISLALDPHSKTVYTLASQPGKKSFLGVFRSHNLGESWLACSTRASTGDGHISLIDKEGQVSYNNCIAVKPGHPDTVIFGAVDMYRSKDRGSTWTRISDGSITGEPHSDHHALAIVGDVVYSANDGGFAVSLDGGDVWETRNNGLAAGMVYSMDVSPANSSFIGIGTQDNGVWLQGIPKPVLKKTADPPDTSFRRIVSGDGGWVCYDPLDEKKIYASVQRMDIWTNRRDGFESLPLKGIDDAEKKRVWQTVIVMDPTPRKPKRGKKRTVYACSDRVWKTVNDGVNWTPLSEPLDGSIISALAIPVSSPKTMYVGTTDGGFFRSQDGGVSWTRNLAGPLSPGRVITRIDATREDPKHVYYTIGLTAEEVANDTPFDLRPTRVRQGGGFQRFTGGQQGIVIEFAHLYSSVDGGNSWNNEDDLLPNVPHNAVVAFSDLLLVVHDAGVNLKRGDLVVSVSGNLPNVRITDVAYHEHDRLLFVSTYGRGIWRIPASDLATFVPVEPP
jgi:photosystem II stability/assembly factor-like uncharacterized protein